MALLLLLFIALLGGPARAEAWGSSAERTRAEGSRVHPLPGGDLIVLRDQGRGRFALERWSPEQRLRWRTFFEASPRPPLDPWEALRRDTPRLDLDPAALLAEDARRTLAVTDDEVRLIDAEGGRALALRFDLADGRQRRSVLHEGAPAWSVAGGGQATALVLAGEGGDELLVLGPDLTPTHRLPWDRARHTRVEADGRVCGLSDEGLDLALRCLRPGEARWTLARVPKGDQPLRDMQVLSSGADHAWVVAMLGPAGRRPAHLLVARVRLGAPSAEVVTRVGLARLLQDLPEQDPRWLVLRGAAVSEGGELLLHGQLIVPELTSGAARGAAPSAAFDRWALSASASIRFSYLDLLVLSFPPTGGLGWTATLPLRQSSTAETAGEGARLIESVGYSAALLGGALRVQYADPGVVDLSGGPSGRRVLSRDLSLAEGRFGPPVELARLGPEEQYLTRLSGPLDAEASLVSFRVRLSWALPDTTLMGRLDGQPGLREPFLRQGRPDRGSELYLTGRLLGYHEGVVAREPAPLASGLGLGAGGVGLATLGTWAALGATPAGCCVASAAGCAGCAVGVGLARGLGGGPGLGPPGPDDLRWGYEEGYQRARRTMRARWAFVAGATGVSAAAVLASSGLMSRLDGPPPRQVE